MDPQTLKQLYPPSQDELFKLESFKAQAKFYCQIREIQRLDYIKHQGQEPRVFDPISLTWKP
jgi:hypothetical protein